MQLGALYETLLNAAVTLFFPQSVAACQGYLKGDGVGPYYTHAVCHECMSYIKTPAWYPPTRGVQLGRSESNRL